MCPDRELLSAWVDGEVPSPWRETIERHVRSCSACSASVSETERIQALLAADASGIDPAGLLVKDRILAGLARSAPVSARLQPLSFTRRFSVPLPMAAAAVLVFAVLSLALVTSNRRNAELQVAVRKAVEATSVAASGMGMESVIDFISRQDSAVNINITLPAEAFAYGGGDPFIVREADYQAGSRQ